MKVKLIVSGIAARRPTYYEMVLAKIDIIDIKTTGR